MNMLKYEDDDIEYLIEVPHDGISELHSELIDDIVDKQRSATRSNNYETKVKNLKEMKDEFFAQAGKLASFSAAQLLGKIDNDVEPDETQIEMGFKLSSKGEICVVSGSAEANINIKMIWRKKE